MPTTPDNQTPSVPTIPAVPMPTEHATPSGVATAGTDVARTATDAANTDATNGAVAGNANATAQNLMKCPSCGGENAADSRFCRHCGATLVAGVTKPPVAPHASSPAPANGHPTPTAVTTATQVSEVDPNEGVQLTPAEIDARRARQLLDRALTLSEKGDKSGAILAARQAIGLAPNSASGYSMLGLLLERSGDAPHAIAAYEKALALAPDSLLERDSLERLRAASGNSKSGAARIFHFDEQELFAGGPTSPSPDAAVTASVAAVAAEAAASRAANNRTVNGNAVSAGTVSGNASTAAGGNARPLARNVAAGASVGGFGATVPQSASVATPISSLDPNAFDFTPDTRVAPRWLRAVRGENSFYVQALPLLATAVAGLSFLLWAHSVASSRIKPPVVSGYVDTTRSARAQTRQVSGTQPVANATPANGVNEPAFPISNDPRSLTPPDQAPAAMGQTPASGQAAVAQPAAGQSPNAGAGSNATASGRSTAGGASGPRIPSPVRPANPRRIPPAAPRIAARNDDASPFSGLRPPRVDAPGASSPAVRAVPDTPASSGTSSGGGPLKPASGPRGYIRVRGMTINRADPSSAPNRPETATRNAETEARNDAQAGRTDSAIGRATNAIGTGRDTGWQYQQRASLFLEQGDYARAADDYQTAIAAYREQIAKGERVEDARSGIESCQSGLRLAKARLRR